MIPLILLIYLIRSITQELVRSFMCDRVPVLVVNADISFFLIGPPREVQQVRQGGVGLLNGY